MKGEVERGGRDSRGVSQGRGRKGEGAAKEEVKVVPGGGSC